MRISFGEKVFQTLNAAFLAIAGLSCLLPLLHIVSLSLSESDAIMSGYVGIWPVDFTFSSYTFFFEGTRALPAIWNNVVLTVCGIAFSMAFTILAAYPLSRSYFIGRRFYSLAILFTMLFNGGLIPTFLVMRGLGVVGSYWAIWLLGLISAYNMLIMKAGFEGVSSELDDASRIDGCGEWRYMASIALPLVKPMLATLALFYGVGYWNTFLNMLIYVNDSTMHTITVLVQQMILNQQFMREINLSPTEVQNLVPQSLQAVGIVMMILPLLLVYPFVQRYFVNGVMIGSIKG
jgi:putative aldouronate transport system permease protein